MNRHDLEYTKFSKKAAFDFLGKPFFLALNKAQIL